MKYILENANTVLVVRTEGELSEPTPYDTAVLKVAERYGYKISYAELERVVYDHLDAPDAKGLEDKLAEIERIKLARSVYDEANKIDPTKHPIYGFETEY